MTEESRRRAGMTRQSLLTTLAAATLSSVGFVRFPGSVAAELATLARPYDVMSR